MALLTIGLAACTNPTTIGKTSGVLRDSANAISASVLQDDQEFHSTDTSFARYLQFFSDVHKLEQWPELALASLVLDNEFWDEDKTRRDYTLKYIYHKIDPILYRFIPIGRVGNLAPSSARIENPLSRYTFFAFAKERRGNF